MGNRSTRFYPRLEVGIIDVRLVVLTTFLHSVSKKEIPAKRPYLI